MSFQTSEMHSVTESSVSSECIIHGMHMCFTWCSLEQVVGCFCGLLLPKLGCAHLFTSVIPLELITVKSRRERAIPYHRTERENPPN